MSQYPYPPSPYIPPHMGPGGFPFVPPPAASTVAGRQAGVWQSIAGILLVMTGLCVGTVVWQAPASLLVEQMSKQGVVIQDVPGLSKEQFLRFTFTVFSGLCLGLGIALLLMARFVRRGGKVSTICSGLLMAMVSVYFLVNLLGTIFHIAGNPVAIIALLPIGGMLWLCVTTLFKLWAAFQNAGSAAQLAAAQQAQYWMMTQQQQTATGYGYGTGATQGYGYPPPPPPHSLPTITPAPETPNIASDNPTPNQEP